MIPTRWLDDAALLKRAVAGDRDAAATLVQRLMAPAHALAWRMTGSASTAEDVVQDAFLRLWQMAKRWEPRAAVNTFFTRIVINLCYDHHRSNAASPVQSEEEPGDAQDGSVDLLAEIVARQSRAEVRAALYKLSVRHRAVLVMWAYSDMSVHDIAASMDLTENAVHQLLHRARGALRAQLGDESERKGRSNAA